MNSLELRNLYESWHDGPISTAHRREIAELERAERAAVRANPQPAEPEALNIPAERAAIWRQVRRIWRWNRPYRETHWDDLRMRRMFDGARQEWAQRRKQTAPLLIALAALREAESMGSAA